MGKLSRKVSSNTYNAFFPVQEGGGFSHPIYRGSMRRMSGGGIKFKPFFKRVARTAKNIGKRALTELGPELLKIGLSEAPNLLQGKFKQVGKKHGKSLLKRAGNIAKSEWTHSKKQKGGMYSGKRRKKLKKIKAKKPDIFDL